MHLFADICLSLSLLVYLAGLIALVPEPVSRHACARDSLKVAAVLIVSLIWILLAVAMAVVPITQPFDSLLPHPLAVRALIPFILAPLGIVTASSGMFLHAEPEDVPTCFRMWSGWAIIVVPALLISLAGTMLHGSASMQTLTSTLAGAISVLATASTLCALRFAMLRRTGRSCAPSGNPHHAHAAPVLPAASSAHETVPKTYLPHSTTTLALQKSSAPLTASATPSK